MTTAITPVNNHHQFFRTVDDNNHQNPLNVISHQGRRWRSSSSAAAVDGCGSNGTFSAADNDKIGAVPLAPSHRRLRQWQPLSTKTIIAAATINRRCSWQWLPSLWSTTMIGAVRSIQLLLPLMTTIIDKDQLAKERWVSAINTGQGHLQIHPTATSVDKDRCWQRLPTPPSTMTISAFGSIPPPPPSKMTIVDKDCQCRRQWQRSAPSAPPTTAFVYDDHHRRRPPTPSSTTTIVPMAPSYCLLHRGQLASTKTGLQTNTGSVPSLQGKATVITTM
jgi:hypothetical protein